MRSALGMIVLIVLALAACSSSDPELSGFVREPTPSVADVTLPDASRDGASFSMRAAPEALLLVYFGYTSCPDVCPTTLADIRTAFEDLGERAENVDLAMATVDPDRDTPEIITGYVQTFVAGAHGLRTEDDTQLKAAADAFGAAYDVSVAADGDIEVIHTGHVYVVDDAGDLLVTWPFGTEPDAMASDLDILLDSA